LAIEHLYDGEVGGVGAGALAEVVDRLELVPVVEEIEQALRARDRLDAKVSEALRGLDLEEGWASDGALSLTAWLIAHGRRSHRDAEREAKLARRLAELPVTAAAWSGGTLSSGQVAAVVANVSSARAVLYAGHEADMTPVLAELSVRDTAAAMQLWRLRAGACQDGEVGPERPSELYLSQTMEGRRELSGHLGAEDAAVVEAAIAVAKGNDRPEGEGPFPTAPERRANAVVDVCRWFLANYDKAASGTRNRPQLSVIVDLSDLAGAGPGRLADGTAVAASTVLRVACDAVLNRIVMAGRATVLDYGSAVRTVSPALWASLVVRDGHCRHPGCDRPPGWCEAHHVKHFSKGGPTCLSNLVLACSRHHHLWHDHGWDLELDAEGTLVLKSPTGNVITSRPPPVHLVA
jgi:Domain of unknown function (DUF222)